jgi:DNA polymerase-4
LGVKIKFTDFVQTTKEIKWANIDAKTLENLLLEALARGQGKAVRLLGVHIGLSENTHNDENQLTLF